MTSPFMTTSRPEPSNHPMKYCGAVLDRVAIILCLIAILFAGYPAYAQSEQPAGPISKISEDAREIETTIRILNRISSASDLDDEALVGARVKYQSVVNSARDIIAFIDGQSKSITDSLTEIGPPPDAEGVFESDTVSETRARLNQERSSLAVTKTQLEKIIQTAQDAIAAITKARQEAFVDAISKRTNITWVMLEEASGGIASLVSNTLTTFRDWLAFIVANKFWPALGSTFISLGAALFISFNFNRFFGTYLSVMPLIPIISPGYSQLSGQSSCRAPQLPSFSLLPMAFFTSIRSLTNMSAISHSPCSLLFQAWFLRGISAARSSHPESRTGV